MESEGLTLAVDAADTGQGRSTSECGHSLCEQTAQEIFPVEIIVQGEMFHQPGRILSEESQGSVESDRLSTLDPLIHNDICLPLHLKTIWWSCTNLIEGM
jgi:hypothetical protein